MSEDDKQPIIPVNWEQRWSDEAVAFLKPLIKKIRYAFVEREYNAYLQLWEPGYNPKGSFVSMGIRPQAKQKNGNNHAILIAFGWFYEAANNWPEGYIDYMADRAIEQYERFNNGEWPISDIHTDDEVLLRNANATAPVARRTMSHKNNPAVANLKPTQMPELGYSVKKLDTAMTDMWGEDVTSASQKKKSDKARTRPSRYLGFGRSRRIHRGRGGPAIMTAATVSTMKAPRYCHHSMMWIVAEGSGVEHRFDTQSEAEDYYNGEKDSEI